ncbi:MAG: DUF5752 family protein [Pseudomonadota bacterium]
MSNATEPAAISDTEFAIKDCALIALATGRRAASLTEMREILLDINPGSIYYHFWGGLIQPRFEEREYNNDFAGFVRHGLHDSVLAERLAMVLPSEHDGMEALRREVIELIDERLDEADYLLWVRSVAPLEFIRSQIVVFDTGKRVSRPEQLAEEIPNLSTNSIFYHFVDAQQRLSEGTDDFRFWINGFGETYQELVARLQELDPYFMSLSELRSQLSDLFADYFGVTPHE